MGSEFVFAVYNPLPTNHKLIILFHNEFLTAADINAGGELALHFNTHEVEYAGVCFIAVGTYGFDTRRRGRRNLDVVEVPRLAERCQGEFRCSGWNMYVDIIGSLVIAHLAAIVGRRFRPEIKHIAWGTVFLGS